MMCAQHRAIAEKFFNRLRTPVPKTPEVGFCLSVLFLFSLGLHALDLAEAKLK